MRLKYVTNYSNDELVTKSSTVPDCLQFHTSERALVKHEYRDISYKQ